MSEWKPTASGLVTFVKEKMHEPHIYIWDGIGQYITKEFLDDKSTRFSDWYTEEKLEPRRALQDRGLRGYDCIGLIKCYLFGNYHQGNTQFYKKEMDWCTRELIALDFLVKGDIKTLPEQPGLVLWKQGHVGVYVGNGEVIECTTGAPGQHCAKTGGIYKTKLEDREWAVWCEFPGISYEEYKTGEVDPKDKFNVFMPN